MDRLNRAAAIALLGAFIGLGVFFVAPAYAQDGGDASSASQNYVPRDMDSLEQLVAPVALYPDAFLAQVLVACTYPDEVIAASQWLAAGNDPQGIDDQNWDLSVKGVARYPDVLNNLAGNPDFMNNLGDAFINQQSDVMTAIQNLRAEALAAGNLVSCDQEQVLVDGDTIEIVPTNDDLIFIPVYDPSVIYLPRRHLLGERFESLCRFGPGIRVGAWLHHDIDWHDHGIYVGSWGADRPWWRHQPGRNDYLQNRPGIYAPANPGRGEGGGAEGGKWIRDFRKPLPKSTARPGGARPNSGYVTPQRQAPHGNAPSDYGHGSTINQASSRGRNSVEAAKGNTVHEPEPARENPGRAEPPSARPSSPTRGGAMGGYQNGADASRSSSRGAESRGETSRGETNSSNSGGRGAPSSSTPPPPPPQMHR